MKDLDAAYGNVYTVTSPDDPHIYTMTTALDWARRRGFPVRRDGKRLSILWLEQTPEHMTLDNLHGVPGTLHVLPGPRATVVSAYTYRSGGPTREYYRVCSSSVDLEDVLTTLFEEAAWPIRH